MMLAIVLALIVVLVGSDLLAPGRKAGTPRLGL
jgi:hypothetical protein